VMPTTWMDCDGQGLAGDKAHITTKGETTFVRFSIARHRGKNGEITEWWNCVAFDEQVRKECERIEKGDVVSVKGHLEQRKDDKGVIYVGVVVHRAYVSAQKAAPAGKAGPTEGEDDEIAF
jgi:hypothetical protein